MEGVLKLNYNLQIQITKLKHKLILQYKYTTPIQGYTGEYKYTL